MNTIRIEETKLGIESDFSLFQFIISTKQGTHVKDVFVKFRGEVVAQNANETLEFFAILDSLVKKGLSEGNKNHFFIYSQKKEKDNTITRSLEFNLAPKIYISPVTAKTMCRFYNESKNGLSYKNAYKSKVHFSIDTEMKTTSQKADFLSDNELDEMINEVLENKDAKYDNTNYYSKKITDLINTVKYNK